MDEQKFFKRKKKAANKKQLAEICHEFGDFYNNKCQYEKALEQYEHCSNIYDQLGLKLESAQAHRMIGEMYMLLDKYEEALMHEDIYLSVARECKNRVEEQRALATLGRIHLVMGQCVKDKVTSASSLKAAERAFMKSFVLCESLKGKINNYELMDMKARLLLNIGVVQQHVGNFNRALEFTQKAIAICKSHDLFDLLNQCYIREGDFHLMNQNDTSKAFLAFNLAFDIAGRLEEKVARQCEALSHKADTLCKMADFYSAKSVLKKAWKMKSPDHTERREIEKKLKIVVAMCYTEDLLLTSDPNDHKKFKSLFEKLGDGACSLNNFEKAIEYYHKMLEHAEKGGETGKQIIPIYVSLYQTYKDVEDYEKVLEYQRKEYDIIQDEPTEAFTTLVCMAETLASMTDRHREVMDTYLKAKEMAEHLHRTKKVEILKLLIEYLEEKGFDDDTSQYKQELAHLNITSDENDDENSHNEEDSDTESNPKNTPNIGDEICLDDISDISDNENEEEDKPRVARKRGRGFIMKKNAKGETQLHQACISGNSLLVTRLISQGHPVNVRDNAGWLPIHEACIHGNKEVVEILIKNGALIDDRGGAQCDGITPMQDAASNGFLEIVELLIDNGGAVSIKNDRGETVLDILKKWRKNESLDASEQIFYETLCDRIQKVLGRLVETPTKTPVKHTPSNSSSTDDTKKRQTKSFDKKRTVQLNDDEEDLSFALTLKARNRNIIDDSSDDSSVVEDSPKRIQSKSKNNAVKDYRNAIEMLKNRNLSTGLDDFGKRNDFNKPKASGYLAPDEVGDDWLEDDMKTAQGKKRKRKESQEFVVGKDKSKQSQVSPFKSSHERTLQKIDPNTDVVNCLGFLENPPIDDWMDSDSNSTTSDILIQENLLPPQRHSFSPTLKRFPSSESVFKDKSNRKKFKRQLTLVKTGFTRNKTDRPKVHSTSFDAGGSDTETCSNFSFKSNKSSKSLGNSEEPDSTTEQSHWSPFKRSQSQRQSIEPPQMKTQPPPTYISPSQQPSMVPTALRVRVQDKLLLVPVILNNADTLTIGWLSKEVSRRYYNIEGVQPTLSLQTFDGAFLAEEDPLSLVIGSGELQANIISWNLPPVGERYIECCNQFKTAVDDHLRNTLEISQATHLLNLSNLNLCPQEVQPVFKSLNHQINLTELSLTNNCLGNDGVKYLAQSLPTLNHIRKINLSGNGIDSGGLRHLLLSFEKSHALFVNHLEFDFSYNPIGELGFSYIMNLTSYVRIRSLNVRACDIDLRASENIAVSLQFIEFLDLSCNNLQKNVIRVLLDSINTFSIEFLKLEGLDINGDLISNIFDNNTYIKLKELDLSRCNLNDTDVALLLRSLSKCENVKKIRLTYNKGLSVLSLKKLIQHSPSLETIDLEGCPQIFKYIQDSDFAQNWFLDSQQQQCDIKMIKLTVNDSQDKFVERFANMWSGKWANSGVVEKDIYGQLVLNVSL